MMTPSPDAATEPSTAEGRAFVEAVSKAMLDPSLASFFSGTGRPQPVAIVHIAEAARKAITAMESERPTDFGNWLGYEGTIAAAMAGELFGSYLVAAYAAAETPEPCSACHGTRWTEDENWSPAYPESWDGSRSPHDGLIPCGFCNEGGWDTPLAAETSEPEASEG